MPTGWIVRPRRSRRLLAAAAVVAAAAVATVAHARPGLAPPGDPPPPRTASAAAVRRYVEALAFVTAPGQVAEGRFGRARRHLRFEPAADAGTFTAAQMARGRVVARVVNLDTAAYPALALAAHDTAYWFVIGAGSGSRSVFRSLRGKVPYYRELPCRKVPDPRGADDAGEPPVYDVMARADSGSSQICPCYPDGSCCSSQFEAFAAPLPSVSKPGAARGAAPRRDTTDGGAVRRRPRPDDAPAAARAPRAGRVTAS